MTDYHHLDGNGVDPAIVGLLVDGMAGLLTTVADMLRRKVCTTINMAADIEIQGDRDGDLPSLVKLRLIKPERSSDNLQMVLARTEVWLQAVEAAFRRRLANELDDLGFLIASSEIDNNVLFLSIHPRPPKEEDPDNPIPTVSSVRRPH